MAAPETTTEVSATARRLIGHYGWQLLGMRELAELAGAEAGAPPAACYSAMGRALYAACVAVAAPGATAAARQRQVVAYEDLRRYLTVLARRLPLPAGGAVEDGVQDALLTVCATLSACRQPAGFLAWVATILARNEQTCHKGNNAEVALWGQKAGI